jgi:tetratricopeptide (TPR) repeat protein
VDAKILEKQHIQLQSLLSMVMVGQEKHRTRLEIHRQQLATGLIDEKSPEGLTIKHNLAHTLLKLHKIEEAKAINRELLEFAESAEGKSIVSIRLYLIMLNLKATILRMSDSRTSWEEGNVYPESANPGSNREQLRIHELVCKLSTEKLGMEDIDTWKAFNNLIGFYNENKLCKNMGQIFPDILRDGLAAKIIADGKFRKCLSEITENARHYLEFLVTSESEKSATAVEFAALLAEWISCSGSSPEQTNWHNTQGVAMQHKGRFEEAEKFHRRAIELCLLERIEEVSDLYWYNLMLAVGRQGRIEEALALRDEHKIEIETAELAFGTLEARLERDKFDLELYKQARGLIAAGLLPKDGEWWRANQNALSRAERRYGFLDRGS